MHCPATFGQISSKSPQSRAACRNALPNTSEMAPIEMVQHGGWTISRCPNVFKILSRLLSVSAVQPSLNVSILLLELSVGTAEE